ncbi:MAG: hypothetical protein ACK56I_29905 [bacterium]
MEGRRGVGGAKSVFGGPGGEVGGTFEGVGDERIERGSAEGDAAGRHRCDRELGAFTEACFPREGVIAVVGGRGDFEEILAGW